MSQVALANRAGMGLSVGAAVGLTVFAAHVALALWGGPVRGPCGCHHHFTRALPHWPIELSLLLLIPTLAGAGQWLAVVGGAARDASLAFPRSSAPTGPPGIGPLRLAVCAVHAQTLGALLLSLGLALFDLAGLFQALEGRLPGIDRSRWAWASAGAAVLLAFALLLGLTSLLPRPRSLSPLQVVLVSVSSAGGAVFWSLAVLIYLRVIR